MLKLRFLGPLEVYLDEKPVRLPTQKSALLLAYLVTFRDRAHPRETLAALYWGETSEERAHNSLRNALTLLRKALPTPASSPPYIIASGGSLRFNDKTTFDLDILTLETATQEGSSLNMQQAQSLQTTLALYRGPFLQGFFEDWILQEQMHWQDLFLEGTLRLSQFLEEAGEHSQTIALCHHALKACPLNEQLYRFLMRAYALHGDRNAALSQYDMLAQRLKAEMDLEPLPETQALHEEILANSLIMPKRGLRPVASAAVAPERSPFVGRQDLMERLLADCQSLQQQKRRFMVLIKGEPGIGKSRFLDEAMVNLPAQGIRCLRANCLPTPLSPFDPIVQALQEDVPDLQDLLEALPPYLQDALRSLIPPWGSSNGLSFTLPPDQIQARRFQALSMLFKELAQRQPICLVLDDLQWGDESTLQWLDFAFRRRSETPLLCLGAYRGQEVGEKHPLNTLRADLSAQGLLEEWDMPLLSGAQSAQLTSQLLQRPLIGNDELNRALLNLTRGNPFYLCELMIGLNQSGLLAGDLQQEDDWKTRLMKYLPQTVQTALEERLRRLSMTGRHLLEVGSVLGQGWPFSLAAMVSGQRRARLVEAIKELLHAHLLVEQENQYAFAHDILRKYVYQHLPHAQRQYLHEKAGLALERQSEFEAAGPALLAGHFEQAGLHDKAVHYLLEAATQMLHTYALKEALGFLKRAEAELMKNRGKIKPTTLVYKRQLYIQRTAIYDMLGQREDQRDAINTLAGLAKASGDPETRLQTHLHHGHWARVTGHFDEAIQEAQNMADLAQREGDTLYQALALRQLSKAYRSLGQYEQALAYAEQAEEIYTPLPAWIAGLAISDNRDVLYTFLGQFDKSLAYYHRKLEEIKGVEDPFVHMEVLGNLGITLENLGNYPEALDHYQKVYDLAQQTGNRLTEGAMLNNMGSALWAAGSSKEALTHSIQSLSVLKEVGYLRAELSVTINMGSIYADLNEHGQALRCFDSALEAVRAKKLSDLEVEILWRKGAVLLNLGQREEALALSTCAVALIERGASLPTLTSVYLNHARILEANNEVKASRQFLKRAYDELMRRAARIEREDLRAMFLQNVRDHREIVSQWHAMRENIEREP